MVKIEAVIRPSSLDKVKQLLGHPWISGITIAEVKGAGRQKGHSEFYRGAEYVIDLLPKLKVEIVIPEPLAPRIVDDLCRLLRSGRIGDGKLFVTRVEEAMRIRTGERGEAAL